MYIRGPPRDLVGQSDLGKFRYHYIAISSFMSLFQIFLTFYRMLYMYVCKVRGTRQKILSIKYTDMFWRTPWPISSTMLHPICVTETPGHWMALWSTELKIGGGYYKKN